MQETAPIKRRRISKEKNVKLGIMDIFLRDGYSAASVDDITERAKVSKATLYKYYPEKSLMFREALKLALEISIALRPSRLQTH